MNDRRHEIPTWALINAMILEEAIGTDDFARCVRMIEKRIKVQPGSLAGRHQFFNHAYTVSMLYCLIVVPKEVWLLSENHAIYDCIDKDWLLSLFKVELADDRFEKHPVYYLIHHLRNAIAHARFSIDDGQFAFYDQRSEASPPYFRAAASFDALGEFLARVGKMFADLRLLGGKEDIQGK